MVAMTYQGPYKHNYCYSAVTMAIRQRRIAPLHYASQPICQCMAIHGWGRWAHQEGYKAWTAQELLGESSSIIQDVE